jgi:hypothetical protein
VLDANRQTGTVSGKVLNEEPDQDLSTQRRLRKGEVDSVPMTFELGVPLTPEDSVAVADIP